MCRRQQEGDLMMLSSCEITGRGCMASTSMSNTALAIAPRYLSCKFEVFVDLVTL